MAEIEMSKTPKRKRRLGEQKQGKQKTAYKMARKKRQAPKSIARAKDIDKNS